MNDLVSKSIIVILVLAGIYFIAYYLISKDWFVNFLANISGNLKKVERSIKDSYDKFMKTYIARENSGFRKWYEKFLMFADISVEKFMSIKLWLAAIAIVMAILVKQTDIQVYTSELYTKFQYEQDVILQHIGEFTAAEKAEILKLKQTYLDEALSKINRVYFEQNDKNLVQDYLKIIIDGVGNDTEISSESYANEVYYKLKKYYSVRKINIGSYLMIGFILFMVPDVIMLVYNFFVKVDSKNELSFMKRLIIMNGSIKPVDFIEVLKSLIDKSTYYKKILEEIQDKNKKNYLPNTAIYLPYIRASKNISEKLFFEKLDEANNYDFDQAILNIKNEFRLDKRMQTRRIKKTVEVIHIFGIVGFMGLIVVLVMYLILPWMSAYKLDSMM